MTSAAVESVGGVGKRRECGVQAVLAAPVGFVVGFGGDVSDQLLEGVGVGPQDRVGYGGDPEMHRQGVGAVAGIHAGWRRGPSEHDWYAHLVRVDRRKCLLITHAGTLFSVFVPNVTAAGLRPIGPGVVAAIQTALRTQGLPIEILGELDVI